MTRAEFLRLAGMTAAVVAHKSIPLSATATAIKSKRDPIVPMLYGSPRPETDLDLWFASMQRWGVRRWMPMLNDFRNSANTGLDSRGSIVPFLSEAVPEFRKELDFTEEHRKAAHIINQSRYCDQYGLEFWCGLPFPIFPNQDNSVIRRTLPDLFVDGKFDLRNRRVPEILQREIRGLKKNLPNLKGVNLWLAEGAGGVALSHEDIDRAAEWQTPLIHAFNAVNKELGIGGILFAHNYELTVQGRRAEYQMAASFPKLTVMEDITWPEEDMSHPFLAYLRPEDRAFLFKSNPVALNFLLDTEYIGQGVLPSVYPRWWKRNLLEAIGAGAKVAMGRTFFWDGGYTDINFNRLNAYIFTHLCQNPTADEKELLANGAKDMFGKSISPELIEILWEAEPVVREIIGINGVDPLSHSRFPKGETLDIVYSTRQEGMKAVSDLFDTPGTRLYPKLTADLSNLKQWRWQNRIVSEEAQMYLNEKHMASRWTENALTSVDRLSKNLSPHHRDMFVCAYQTLRTLAKGMELFVETAALHHDWAHDKRLDDGPARTQFVRLAARFRDLAATMSEDTLGYQTGMVRFASFLETKLPRLSVGLSDHT